MYPMDHKYCRIYRFQQTRTVLMSFEIYMFLIGIYTYNIVFSVAISGGTGTLPIRNYAVNIAAVAIEEDIINSLCC